MRQTLVCLRWFSSAAVGFSKGRIDAGSDFFVGAPQFSRMSNVCFLNLRRHSRMGRMKCLRPPWFSRMAHRGFGEKPSSREWRLQIMKNHDFDRSDVGKSTLSVDPTFGKTLFSSIRRLEKYCFCQADVRKNTIFVKARFDILSISLGNSTFRGLRSLQRAILSLFFA